MSNYTVKLKSKSAYKIQTIYSGVDLWVNNVIISPTEPPFSGLEPGFFWWNPVNWVLSVLIRTQNSLYWVALSPPVPLALKNIDDISDQFNGSEVNFILTSNSELLTPIESNGLIVFLGGVHQQSGVSYNINSDDSIITFTEAPSSGLDFSGILGTRTVIPSGDPLLSSTPVFKTFDDISSLFNGTRVTFPLKMDGSDTTPTPSFNLLVFIGGVIQVPPNSFSVWESTITFTEAPPTGVSSTILTSTFG